jgi:2-isopropylmalate synthase
LSREISASGDLDKKQEVFDEDLIAILHDEMRAEAEHYSLEYLHIYSGTSAIRTATVRLRVSEEKREGAAIGDGPLDAACKAIRAVTGASVQLERYEIRAVTSGTEAMGEVTMQLSDGARKMIGRAASTDVIEAGARAFLEGLNRLARAAKSAAAT